MSEVMEMVDYISTDRRRGCLAAFPHSLSPRVRISNDKLSLSLLQTVDEVLASIVAKDPEYIILLPLPYRRPPSDVRRTLHRWDSRPPSEIFETGFQARDRGWYDNKYYYDLRKYVKSGQLLSDIRTPFAYVSTTKRRDFMPLVDERAREKIIYQYHIRAPGGIRVNKAMKVEHTFQNQKEIAFVQGINRAYIVSATPFYCDRLGTLERRGDEENNLHFVL